MDYETALAVCKKNLEVDSKISLIGAMDSAESERSIVFKFTAEESHEIFAFVLSVLGGRKKPAQVKNG